jgi:hypothetical protein
MKHYALLALALTATQLVAQDTTAGRGRGRGGGRQVVVTDTARGTRAVREQGPEDLNGCGAQCATQMATKKRADSAYEARAKGNYEFHKVKYKSRVDGLEIPRTCSRR